MDVKLRSRILPQGTVVELTTVIESGTTVEKGKVKMILDINEKKYLVHIKNTEFKVEVHDIVPEDLEPPYRYISGAYDKYGRPIE